MRGSMNASTRSSGRASREPSASSWLNVPTGQPSSSTTSPTWCAARVDRWRARANRLAERRHTDSCMIAESGCAMRASATARIISLVLTTPVARRFSETYRRWRCWRTMRRAASRIDVSGVTTSTLGGHQLSNRHLRQRECLAPRAARTHAAGSEQIGSAQDADHRVATVDDRQRGDPPRRHLLLGFDRVLRFRDRANRLDHEFANRCRKRFHGSYLDTARRAPTCTSGSGEQLRPAASAPIARF